MRDYTGHEGLAGWYDAFFDAKPALGEVPPFSVLMSTTPCLAKIPKFIFTPDETFTANLLVRNELAEAIPAGTLWHWSFGAHAGWAKAKSAIPPGALAEVGTVSVPLAGFDAPGAECFTGWLLGATRTNPLEPHRYCEKCHRVEFHPEAQGLRRLQQALYHLRKDRDHTHGRHQERQ